MKINRIFLLLFISNYCHALDTSENLSDYTAQENPPLVEEITEPQAPFNFDQIEQPFILETKKIDIPGHPFAFNPSVIKWKGSLLMSFRTYKPETRSTNPFGLVWLNEEFEPISTPQLFELPFKNPLLPSKQQDPRLITVGERLFVLYNNILENVTHREMRRMFIVEIKYDGVTFTALEPECLEHFEEENIARYEKNWVPFEYQNELYLGYSIIPHRILHPNLGTGTCDTVFSTKKNFKWDWGVPRGGTQAILDGDHYLAILHSWVDIPSVQSDGKKITHYLMGAYTFDATPPFSIRSISPEPIVAKDFYQPPYYRTWKPLRCVFPAGLIIDEHFIWIAYGRQDHECWVVKLDKKELLKSLIPVSEQ